jgi:hypothetical protein
MADIVERTEAARHVWFPQRASYEHLGPEALAVLDDFAWTIYCFRAGAAMDADDEAACEAADLKPARCPSCGRDYVQQWQRAWITWDCFVDGEHVEFGRRPVPEIQQLAPGESYYRCGSCDTRGFSEADIVTASQ